MRLLVVVVVTVALLAAAAPLALTQAPRLHSPVLALLAFGVAVIALVAGVAMLVRATMLHRRTRRQAVGPRREPLQARVVSAPRSGADASAPRRVARLEPGGDDAETDPRPGPERILLVPTSGRIAVSAGASLRGPRHALDDEGAADQSRQAPDTTGQSPAGPSQTHAQQTSADDAADPAAGEAIAARSASFAARYTATRSRR